MLESGADALRALPPPDPEGLGPFRFSSPNKLAALLREAGLSEVRIARLQMHIECESVAQYCRIFGDLAWSERMARLSAEEMSRFQQAVAEAVIPYRQPDGRLRLGAVSLCASARRD